MDSAYLQRIRFQLQKRFRRLNSCSYLLFHSSVVQFWNYLQANPLTAGILAKLEAEALPYTAEISDITTKHEIAEFTTEAEQFGFVYRVVQHCALQPLANHLGPEVKIGHALSNERKHDEALNHFREIFLEPLYEYVDDALDQQGAVLSLLIKYKRKVEWFERDVLAELAAGDERMLAKHLYAYLFDQGLDFHVEPQSVSGEADLVAPELVLDAKVFDGARRGVSYLASGVHQVHTYARDFNQEVGYLVVYKTCPETLDFPFSASGQLAPCLTVGGKTIYIFVVDVCHYESTASKRGAMKVHTIDQDYLLRNATGPVAISEGSSDLTS
jgi:hypothetical protein